MATEKALRYTGGASLTFRDGAGARRTVQHGHTFLVDLATARILLEDPFVAQAEDDGLPVELPPVATVVDGGRPPELDETPPQIDITSANKAALLEYAGLLGLSVTTRTTVPHLRASIEAELKRRQELRAPLVDEAAVATVDGAEGNEGGEDAPGDDPDASATGEPGTPPEETGAITLGDLPEGAKVKKGT